MKWVILGSILIVVMMWVLLTFHPMQGAATLWYQNLFAGIFVVVFGFLFVTVASRISGLLGNSSNPISGMSIATPGHLRHFFSPVGPRQTTPS